MSSSSIYGKAWVSIVFNQLSQEGAVRRVLDVGVGAGGYSENLRISGQEWLGIEVWGPYLDKFSLREKYDKIIIADARYVDYSLLGSLDVVFCGDVLEHMNKDEAVRLAEKLLSVSRMVFISLPVVHYPQGAEDGNPFEMHVKDDWTIEEARSSFPSVTVSIVHENIGVLALASNIADKERIVQAAQNAYNAIKKAG